jgi:protein CpxP
MIPSNRQKEIPGMTNRFKSSLAVGVVALAVAAMTSVAMAQDGQMRRRGPGGPGPGGPPPGGGPGMGRGGPMGGPMLPLRALDLTEAQQAQVKSIVDSHQEEMRAAGQKIGAAREAMRTLLEADPIDEAAVRAKSIEVGAAEAELHILQAKLRNEMFAILTPEQLAKAKEMGPRKRRPQR